MLISYKWLGKYFDNLPTPEKVGEALSLYLTEIEKIEKKGDDTIFDVNILADRKCYAQCHQGIAYELSAILKLSPKTPAIKAYSVLGVEPLKIEVEEKEMCSRYIGRRIENLTIRESVPWLKEKLENIGQRSINNIIDTLNYMMFDIGQPLHAFDADKVKGKIIVRFAKDGESLTTLDGKDLKLDSTILVIADEEGPLAIAGIKGGKRAEVTLLTKNIIIESANFNKSLIRATSTKLNIKTDASKRYENGLSTSFCRLGMESATSYISSFNPEVKIGEAIDIYSIKETSKEIKTTFEEIEKIIGMKISKTDILDILKRLEIGAEVKGSEIILVPPLSRLDLNIPEDIAEEVARIYGYEKIPSTPLDKKDLNSEENSNFLWRERVKDILVELDFSEIMTHTLSSKGDFEVEKSASDKNFLRTNLSDNMVEALTLNSYNAPLLGLDQIKIFEIGTIFPAKGEYVSLCIGIANTKIYKGESINEQVRNTREALLEKLGSKATTLCTIDDTGGILVLKGKPIGKINDIDGIMELNLDALEAQLPKPVFTLEFGSSTPKYRPISQYPFVLRDIAVFVQDQIKEPEVLNVIKEHSTDLLVRVDLFDTFTKTFKDTGEVKTSYAYRLVFQSNDKTLTDDEINQIMLKIDSKMAQQGWEVR